MNEFFFVPHKNHFYDIICRNINFQIFQPPWSPHSPTYKFELLEEQPINTILTTLHATDVDSTISEYKLIDGDDNGNEYFEINNITGK